MVTALSLFWSIVSRVLYLIENTLSHWNGTKYYYENEFAPSICRETCFVQIVYDGYFVSQWHITLQVCSLIHCEHYMRNFFRFSFFVLQSVRTRLNIDLHGSTLSSDNKYPLHVLHSMLTSWMIASIKCCSFVVWVEQTISLLRNYRNLGSRFTARSLLELQTASTLSPVYFITFRSTFRFSVGCWDILIHIPICQHLVTLIVPSFRVEDY